MVVHNLNIPFYNAFSHTKGWLHHCETRAYGCCNHNCLTRCINLHSLLCTVFTVKYSSTSTIMKKFLRNSTPWSMCSQFSLTHTHTHARTHAHNTAITERMVMKWTITHACSPHEDLRIVAYNILSYFNEYSWQESPLICTKSPPILQLSMSQA